MYVYMYVCMYVHVTLSHETTSFRKNLNDSARIRQRYLHRKFASKQCAYIKVFSLESFLGKKFPYGISEFSNGKFYAKEEFLLRSLLAGALLLSSWFWILRKRYFPKNNRQISCLATKFPARIPCKKMQIHTKTWFSLYLHAHWRFGKSSKRLCWKAFWQAVSATTFLCMPVFLAARNFVLRKMLFCNFPSKEMVRASLSARNPFYK